MTSRYKKREIKTTDYIKDVEREKTLFAYQSNKFVYL